MADKANEAAEEARLAEERAKLAEAEAADEESQRKAKKAREEANKARADAKTQADLAAQAALRIQASIRGKSVRDEVGFFAELDGIAAERIQGVMRGKETRDAIHDMSGDRGGEDMSGDRGGGDNTTQEGQRTPPQTRSRAGDQGDAIEHAAAARLQGVAKGIEAKQHVKAIEYAQTNAYVHPSKWVDEEEDDTAANDGPSLAELERMMEERSRLRVAQIGFLQKREGEVGAAVMVQKLMRGHLARSKKKKGNDSKPTAATISPPKNKFLAAAEKDFEEDYEDLL